MKPATPRAMHPLPSRREGTVPEAIWKFDLSAITRRLERQGTPNAAALEAEFRRVMALAWCYPTQGVAPSKAVDAFWHETILDTRRYRAFCSAALGVPMLDHIADDTYSGMLTPYSTTLQMYQAEFGEPPADLWGPEGANSMGTAIADSSN